MLWCVLRHVPSEIRVEMLLALTLLLALATVLMLKACIIFHKAKISSTITECFWYRFIKSAHSNSQAILKLL